MRVVMVTIDVERNCVLCEVRVEAEESVVIIGAVFSL
jgi:hypothetical protein